MRIWGLGCLLAAMGVLSGCGGGGSDQPTTYQLGLSPSTLSATFAQGAPSGLVVTATLDRTPSQQISVAVVDSAGVIDPSVQLIQLQGLSYQATIVPKSTLAVGEYSGSLQIKLCYDNPATCSSQVPGSPYTLPYKFTVTVPPAANVQPLRTR